MNNHLWPRHKRLFQLHAHTHILSGREYCNHSHLICGLGSAFLCLLGFAASLEFEFMKSMSLTRFVQLELYAHIRLRESIDPSQRLLLIEIDKFQQVLNAHTVRSINWGRPQPSSMTHPQPNGYQALKKVHCHTSHSIRISIFITLRGLGRMENDTIFRLNRKLVESASDRN